MAAAARLAARARPLSRPNPGVGAIVVKDGRVVGRGWTRPGGRPHAEAMALDMAGPLATGATLYATLEPCMHDSPRGPACADLIARSGLARCVYAVEDPDPRTAGAGAAHIGTSGTVVDKIDCPQAEDSLAGYLMRSRRGRPHVTLKLAMSLDGRIALPSGESRWITGAVARAHVHSRRAMADAILVGGGTWRQDRPRLDVRLPGLESRSPDRVVLTRGEVDGAHAIAEPQAIAGLDGVQYLYIEGGAKAAAAFLSADLVDRLEIYRAPILVGEGLPAIADIGLADLAQAHGRWREDESRQLGSDSWHVYRRVR
ncbi:bifunctional diaminohydroxyphosphoribosylaminopyrimidine deaminase/5-amino-6-(5-phosphoribosylamino)uracil reductase RibD [Qipengyuania sp. JC766]|uniref:bifunctional diaminohydroxyphosphoribosylaminopyrimidine deaminase/5-amino-6-(5-phosphoribosylamino)uracil reductase RibD n=1 Tax=Qipengyuania sp. JC766 TaxID=3232139 RepID=UPI00345A4B09